MKLLAFCLILIANVSDNGKAAIESTLPANSNILLPDTTSSSDKSCYRPCKLNVKPRWCHYHFVIEPTFDDEGRPALVINGKTPGPAIHVCENDIVFVKVENKVPGQDLTLHMHGIEQKGTPYMDGVPMVTQCPISFGSSYKYVYLASSSGTFFYHADSVLHHSDGVYGAIIVDQAQPLEPHSSLYDFDKRKEHTLTIGARFPVLLTGNLDRKVTKPDSVVINGEKKSTKIFVIPGYRYRLRLINAIAVDCPLVVDIDQHSLIVIASDGKPVKPVSTDSVLLYPGERMDVVVEASRESGGYWLNVRGLEACQGLGAHGMLLYSGFNYTALLQEDPILSKSLPQNIKTIPHGQELLSHKDQVIEKEVKISYLAVDRKLIAFKDTDNDYRYLSEVVPKKNFYPAAISLQSNSVVQINNKNFLYPDELYLFRPRDVKRDTTCKVGEEIDNKQLQCVQVLRVLKDTVLQLAIVNEGFGSNDSYTFHMHGYSVQVVATGRMENGMPLSKQEFQLLHQGGGIERNLKNPPLKDTFVVPNKGYTIVRFRAECGGNWMLECRSCGFLSLPVAILIEVPISFPKGVSEAVPKCGSYKPADVLLN